MTNELFKCEIARGDQKMTAFIVASDQDRASDILMQTEIECNREHQGFSLERVDEIMPVDQRRGLDTLLNCGAVGLASYNERIGWITHSVPAPRLHFYRVLDERGDECFIIAPTMDVATSVYCEVSHLEEGKASLFRILDGFFSLKPECMRGLPELLEYGSVGVVQWDEDNGWKMV